MSRDTLSKATRITLSSLVLMTTVIAYADPNSINQLTPESVSPLRLSNQLIRQRDSLQQDLAILESMYGPYDSRLLESLGDLTSVELQLGDFTSAQEILERRLQIVRVEDGLESPSQIPFLEDAIRHDIRVGNWTSASNRFEAINRLMASNSEELSLERLLQAKALKDWYLHAILLDAPDLRESQGRRIGELQFRLMDDAETLFADDPLALVPWLYQDAIDEYRSVSVRRIRRFLGKAPAIFIREKIFRTNEQSIATTFSNLKRIREIYADQGDLEGEAMAMIYLADFRLATSKGSAISLYRGAMDKLEEAGIPPQRINEFFSRPTTIPSAEFHQTLDAAFAAQSARGVSIESDQSPNNSVTGRIHLGTYYAWHPFMPGLERPPVPETARTIELEYETAVLNFSLNSRGQPRNIEFQESTAQEVKMKSPAVKGIQGIRFRPQFINRRWQSMEDVTITYHYPRPASAAAL